MSGENISRIFQKAAPVWLPGEKKGWSEFAGFYAQIYVEKEEDITFRIAARSFYRMYLNGERMADGSARAAKGCCRVDELTVRLSGEAHVAFEVLAMDFPEKYSNDCTLEPGLFTAEITGEDGQILSATGDGSWKCRRLSYRRMNVERMSHSRGIAEYYDLDGHSRDWMLGCAADFETPAPVMEEVCFLPRRAPYPAYRRKTLERFRNLSDRAWTKQEGAGNHAGDEILSLSRMINPGWYAQIPPDNLFLESVIREENHPFTGKCRIFYDAGEKRAEICPGEQDAFLVWSAETPETGFIELTVSAEDACTVDVISSDSAGRDGSLRANTYTARYVLEKGTYHLTTAEPKLVKYVGIVLRTEGKVTVGYPSVIEYTYPDTQECWFECSDGDLNRIYNAARETLRMNTLDIFMDCPQRERGGWLCDSYFTSKGAWQMFGDLSVEKDFIENFMRTGPGEMKCAFFPEVYPGSPKKPGSPGIMNWFFWLVIELAAFYERSGDEKFVEMWENRVSRFIDGVLSLRGESGLLEGLEAPFVDWSLSNTSYCLEPVSIPVNCLTVRMLEEASGLYGVEKWRAQAEEMRVLIEEMDRRDPAGRGDAAVFQDGRLTRSGFETESGLALEIWSGFHWNEKGTLRRFLETMGYSPRFCSDPNVGKPDLFIGLMTRFDVLDRMGEIAQLVREMKDLYLPEGWKAGYEFPAELAGWTISVNGRRL